MNLPLNQIIYGDCLEVMKEFPNESIDFILTDPPFGIGKKEIVGDKSLDTYKKSLPLMEKVLKNNSWFITFASMGLLPKVLEETTRFFEYIWLGFIYYSNMQRIMHSPVGFTKISLFLVFKKGQPKKHYFLRDVLVFTYGSYEKEIIGHPSPKPLKSVCELIKFGSNKNDIILDPFVGSGTTCIGAKKLRRQFIGIEIDSLYHELACQRLAKEGPEMIELEEYFGSTNT